MSKGTSIKDAIKWWAAQPANEGKNIKEEECVKLLALLPCIEKMDSGLSALNHVRQLSLSTNAIDKIANLQGFSNLKILSLGRNNIKSLGGLDPVAGTLEELWISYNLVEKTKGIECLKNLKVLYMSNCKVKDWKEVDNMKALTSLETLVFNGNPLMEKHTADGDYREQMATHLTQIKKLDGIIIPRESAEEE